MTSKTSATAPASCSKSAFVAGLAFDTMLSLDTLLVFLLSGTALFLSVPLFTVSLVSVVVFVFLILYKTLTAYRAFVNLAPGGIPSDAAGFLRATWIARYAPIAFGEGFLELLHLRAGKTPYTSGTAPQHQVNQQSPENVLQYFADRLALFDVLQSDDGASSCGESNLCKCIPSSRLRLFGCDLCSPRGANCGSAHVVLHQSDAERVIQMGWVELHPLARTGCMFSLLRGSACLPRTLMLVYAPREYSEVCTVMRIIEAGAKYLASLDSTDVTSEV